MHALRLNVFRARCSLLLAVLLLLKVSGSERSAKAYQRNSRSLILSLKRP